MDQVHGRGDLVHVLATGALRGRDHFLHFRGIHGGFHILRFRQHGHGRGAGVHAALRLGRGHALHLVRAALVAQVAPAARARDREDRLRNAAGIAGLGLELVDAPTASLRELQVHRAQVACPEPGLIAADAGPHLEDQVPDGAVAGGDEGFLQRVGQA